MIYLAGPAPLVPGSHRAALTLEDEASPHPSFPRGYFTPNKLSIPSAASREAHQTVWILLTSISIPWQSLESTPNLTSCKTWGKLLTLISVFQSLKHK